MSSSEENGNSLKLYYNIHSYYSHRVLMALYEKRVPFKMQSLTLVSQQQYEPWFLKLNPRAEVPVLTDGVKVIPDSNRIIEYLEDNFSNGDFRQLTPKEKGSEESKKIQKFRDMMEIVSVHGLAYGTALHQDLLDNPKPPFTAATQKRFREAIKFRPTMIREYAERNPEFRDVLMQKAADLEHGANSINKTREEMDQLLMMIDSIFENVEEELSSHTEGKSEWWLCGESFSIADIDLAVLLNLLNMLGYERRFWSEGKRPLVQAYWERIQERDSFKRSTTPPKKVVHLTMLRGTLKERKALLASLTAAVGVAVLSYVVYRRVQKS